MNGPASRPAEIRHPWGTAPGPGAAVEVADGILWARLPLPMALDHVNVYALDDGDGWTLIDAGMNWEKGRAQMDALLAGPLAGKPVRRVVLTHHHPDHIGLAGRFAGEGAEILASRIAWLMGRMLVLDRREEQAPQSVEFRRLAGVAGPELDAFRAEPPFNFADCVAPIPPGFRALENLDRLRAGGRDWTVRLGEGHAPAHVTLWSDDVLLAGDQVLPGISPNIGVWPMEPEANPLAGWLETCRGFRALGPFDAAPLVLPGHKLPFTGLDVRLRQLIEHHAAVLKRVLAALAAPNAPALTAVGMMPTIFRREIGDGEFGLALAEAVAHANWLHRAGLTVATATPEGARAYRCAPFGPGESPRHRLHIAMGESK